MYKSLLGLALAASLAGGVVLGDAHVGLAKLIWGFGFGVLFAVSAWRVRTSPLARLESATVLAAVGAWGLLWLPFHAVVACSCLKSDSGLMSACSRLGDAIKATTGMASVLSWMLGPYGAMALALLLGARGLWMRRSRRNLTVAA